VTIGNVIGGALMVGIAYWFVYLRRVRQTDAGHDEGSDQAGQGQGG
jgi:hypothetical protein